MKLCFISNPQSIHTRRWLEWFAARDHAVQLIADAPIQAKWQGIRTYDLTRRFNLRVIRFVVWGLLIKRLLRQWQPDILHAHRVSSAGWLGAFSGFHPFVVAPWGSDLLVHPFRSRTARWLAKYSLQRADLVITNSEGLRQNSLQFGAHPERICFVKWTAVDQTQFHPGIDTAALKASIGLGDEPVVLSPRAIAPIYNIDQIIQAIPAVRQAVPGVKFVFLEFNVKQDYLQSLLRLISDLDVGASIRWAGEFETSDQMAQLFNLADVAVSVSSSDSMPPSILEAMACGVPVVSSDIPSLREWIVDGENGLLTPLGNSRALADALITLLKNPNLANSFRQKNLELVREHADYQTEMLKVEQCYYNLL